MKILSAKLPALDVVITTRLDDAESYTVHFRDGKEVEHLGAAAHMELELLSLTCLARTQRLSEPDFQARAVEFLKSWDSSVVSLEPDELLDMFSEPDMEDFETMRGELHDCFLIAGMVARTDDDFLQGLPEELKGKLEKVQKTLETVMANDPEELIHTDYPADNRMRGYAEKFFMKLDNLKYAQRSVERAQQKPKQKVVLSL